MGIGGLIEGVADIWLGTEQAIAESKAATRQAELDQAVLTYNARQAELQGFREAGKRRMLGSQTVADQKVAYANSGVDSTSGTAAAVQKDTAALSELDAQTIKNNAAREAWGFKLQREQSRENLDTKLGSIRRQQYGSIVTGLGKFAGGAASMGGEG